MYFVALFVLVAQCALWSQVGQYPGGYPPGQYPGRGGSPFPLPRGGTRGDPGRRASPQTAVQVKGKLRRIDSKSLVIDVDDGRVVEMRQTTETKFYDGKGEIRASDLKAGDSVSAEARQDEQGNLYAQSVRLELRGSVADQPAARAAPPAAAPDADDPGPPRLQRGIPEKRKGADAPSSTDTAQSEERAPEPGPQPEAEQMDPLIAKARAAAENFAVGLPNYVCKEFMARFASDSRPVEWRALDVVSTEVVYEKGRESYRNLEINGKPVRKTIEEIGGAWSTGEFGTMLRDLLSPATAAAFHFRRESSAAGARARVYEFDVARSGSHWHVHVASQSIDPAYKGSVWIDPASGRVLRIETQAVSLPRDFPLDTVESAVDYENVRIGSQQVLLPVHAENLACQRGTSACSRNVIDFRNYHKYSAESNVTFEEKE